MSPQEKIWFEKLKQKRTKCFEAINDPEYRNVFNGVVDMYTQKTHFIYELLQNADDAQATMARFELYEDRVCFKHNGKVKFTVSDPEQAEPDRLAGKLGSVNSITAIGFSTKSQNLDAEHGLIKIGKFGVGFKAVFQYTNTPKIYNTNISFQIDNFIVPSLIDEDANLLDSGYTTCFILPFNSINQPKSQANKEISVAIKKIENPILFLPHLSKLEFETRDGVIVFEKNVNAEKSFQKDDISVKYIKSVRKDDKTVNSYFWFFEKSINIGGSVFPITVGYELNQNQTIKTNVRPNLYCFFSVNDSVDLCLYLNAPFELVSNRQNITEGDVNSQIFDELSSLAAQTLSILRDIGLTNGSRLLNDNIFRIVATSEVNENEDEIKYISPFYKAFLKVLQKEALFITEDGRYVTANEGIDSRDEIMNLLNETQLNEFIECSYKEYDGTDFSFIYRKKDSQIRSIDDYLKDIGIKQINEKEFADELSAEFLEKQDDQWLRKFYEFLNLDLCNKLLKYVKRSTSVPHFRQKPIIRLSNGQFVPPYKEDGTVNVFMPSIANFTNLNIVDDKLLFDENFKEVLEKLDIKQPDELDYIRNVIFPKGDADDPQITNDDMVEDLYVIYNHYMSYSASENNERDAFVKECSRHWILKGKKGKEDFFCLPNIYIKSQFLDRYFVGEYTYLNEDLYRDRFGGVWDNFMNFLEEFDINSRIKVEERHNTQQDAIKEAFPNIQYNQLNFFTDYILDGKFSQFILRDDYSIDDSIEIYNTLLHNHDKQACIDYVYYRYYNEYAIPKFIRECKNSQNKWLFDRNGVLKSVDELTAEELDERYDRNADLLTLLDIKSVPGLSQHELIEKLDPEHRRIYELGTKFSNVTPEEEQKIYRMLEKDRRRRELAPAEDMQLPDRQNDIDQEEPFVAVNRIETKGTGPFPPPPPPQPENNLLNDISQDTMYSAKWFVDMLKYESFLRGEREGKTSGLTIRFSNYLVNEEAYIICLSNPSRNIPSTIECMDNIIVRFNFSNRAPIDIAFDAASVKEYSIVLKCRKSDKNEITQIVNQQADFISAILTTETSIPLIDELRNSFEKLPLSYDDSLENHLPQNLKFLFGPPGTGKTTKLVSDFILKMSISPHKKKILFLAPTNKACDVILRKAHKKINPRSNPQLWLGRFAQTMDESLAQYVVSGGFQIQNKDKYCLISTMARFPYDGFSSQNLNDIAWDVIVIDEASMIPLAYIIYAVLKYPQTEFVIAGDPFQIEPIVKAPQWEGENIYSFVGLNNYKNDVTMLNNYPVCKLKEQYRSVSAIGNLFSQYRYNGAIKHARGMQRTKELKLNGIDIKTNNFIYFHSGSDDGSVFTPQKIQTSNIQVYSILLVYEFLRYMIKNISKNNCESWKIGVICPYKAEADVIQKLWSQYADYDANMIDVQIGTIHGFQGDECDVIIAVYNPPAAGLERYAAETFINNKNIMNVAISRASDYFFLFYPDRMTPNFHKMYEINQIGRIALEDKENYFGMSAEQLERVLFDDSHFIERNSFVTYHQMSNIYTTPIKKYEIRVDESAVDVILKDDDVDTD